MIVNVRIDRLRAQTSGIGDLPAVRRAIAVAVGQRLGRTVAAEQLAPATIVRVSAAVAAHIGKPGREP